MVAHRSVNLLFIHGASATQTEIGICRDGIWAERSFVGHPSAQKVLLLLDELWHAEQASDTVWDALVCAVGPGSFTGIRIAACVIQTLSLLKGVPMIPVRSEREGVTLHGVRDLWPDANEAFKQQQWIQPFQSLPLHLVSNFG